MWKTQEYFLSFFLVPAYHSTPLNYDLLNRFHFFSIQSTNPFVCGIVIRYRWSAMNNKANSQNLHIIILYETYKWVEFYKCKWTLQQRSQSSVFFVDLHLILRLNEMKLNGSSGQLYLALPLGLVFWERELVKYNQRQAFMLS